MSEFDSSTMDAQKWAEYFVKTKNECGWELHDIDESLMLTWFADAIMAGYDQAYREGKDT